MATAAETVTAIKQAIYDITFGQMQSVNVGGRSFTYLQIGELNTLLKEWESRAADEAASVSGVSSRRAYLGNSI